jgi:hypothetical protein
MAGQESLQLLLSTAEVVCVFVCYLAHRVHCGPLIQSSAQARLITSTICV